MWVWFPDTKGKPLEEVAAIFGDVGMLSLLFYYADSQALTDGPQQMKLWCISVISTFLSTTSTVVLVMRKSALLCMLKMLQMVGGKPEGRGNGNRW